MQTVGSGLTGPRISGLALWLAWPRISSILPGLAELCTSSRAHSHAARFCSPKFVGSKANSAAANA
eukprot:5566749-Heterocapsa_arctica.AAC.1